MNKRSLIATMLCMAIWLGWQTFFAPPPKKKVAKAAPVAATAPPTPSPGSASTTANAEVPPAAALVPTPQESKQAFKTPLYEAILTSQGGGFSQLSLLQYREAVPNQPKEKRQVELVRGAPALSLTLDGQVLAFAAWQLANDTLSTTAQHQGWTVELAWKLSRDGYTHSLSGNIKNENGEARSTSLGVVISGAYDERLLKDRSFYDPPPDLATPLAQLAGSVSRHTKDKQDSPEAAKVDWFGVDRQYFLIAAAPTVPALSAKQVRFTEAKVEGNITRVESVLTHDPVTIQPQGVQAFGFDVFAGPKASEALAASHRGFENALDYSLMGLPLGFLARPMQWVLNQGFAYTGSWGLAIILLTLVVKLLMFPVTQKSYESMQQMRDLKPELDRIKARFPNDREKQGLETMRLYRERKVSPFLSGCLPALLQFPVWVAMWRMLAAAVELYQREFLWLSDLTAKDPYYILPAILGGLMFLQQKISPPMAEPEQQKIMMFMPVIMVVFMIGFPSGLVFYNVVNTVLTIAQQLYISKKFGATKPASA